jgi:hypothetical protein
MQNCSNSSAEKMAYRRAGDSAGEGESDCFEQIYWCGLLLYLAGDPADVPLMWEGKRIDMDTAIGFDGQFLVGAGVEETIKYLEELGQRDPATTFTQTTPCRKTPAS